MMAPYADPSSKRQGREALLSCSPPLVARALERELLLTFGAIWDFGWLPRELLRQVRRATSAAGERLAATAIAADHHRRHRSTLHPRWAAMVDELDLPGISATEGWIAHLGGAGSAPWATVVDTALDVLHAMFRLGPLPVIVPPPGSSTSNPSMAAVPATGANPVLEKVRGLLAQAESTTFEAEAEAFTAKAQELMARHAIDAAVVWGRSSRREQPITIRIPLAEPYVDAKSMLLHVVAKHSRCQSVFHPDWAMSSVVGFEGDVIAVETLFTSLLVQAQASLGRATASAPPGSRHRSRSFRSSFLVSYATRIRERLEAIGEHVMAEAQAADGGGALLPVLAERSSAVDDAVREQFGDLVRGGVRGGYDLAGWAAGSQAADLAQLSLGDLPAPAA
jgi:hypothetical protein